MMSCVIIDDEPSAINGLKYELKNFESQIEIINEFSDAQNAMLFLRNTAVDVVFLDIEMPGMNGLSLLEHFPNRNFHVIFTTAYSKYAINAIKIEAIDYLLKPIDSEDLELALKKTEKYIAKKKHEDLLELAIDKLNKTDQFPKRIKISNEGKINFFSPDEIIYCEGEGSYCTVYFESGKKMMLSNNLKQMESILPASIFYRIHNSFIVNLLKIRTYNKTDGCVEVSNKVIPVSRNKREEIINKLSL